jgi:adenine-specific DNA-methyltransferase
MFATRTSLGGGRARARAAALAAGVPLTGLASSWAAFTVHAAQFLVPGGRLGLVLPAELLTVNYAAEVRRHLMAAFGRVRLVLFTERVFPGVQEEVVLLLAEDALAKGGTDHCELRQVRTAADLAAATGQPHTGIGYRWTPKHTHGKWTPALLSADALDAYTAVEENPAFETLHASACGTSTGSAMTRSRTPTSDRAPAPISVTPNRPTSRSSSLTGSTTSKPDPDRRAEQAHTSPGDAAAHPVALIRRPSS